MRDLKSLLCSIGFLCVVVAYTLCIITTVNHLMHMTACPNCDSVPTNITCTSCDSDPKSDPVNTEWRNCDTAPPNFSGVCCRWLKDQQEWECRRHTGDKGFSEEDNVSVPWLEGIDPKTQEREG